MGIPEISLPEEDVIYTATRSGRHIWPIAQPQDKLGKVGAPKQGAHLCSYRCYLERLTEERGPHALCTRIEQDLLQCLTCHEPVDPVIAICPQHRQSRGADGTMTPLLLARFH